MSTFGRCIHCLLCCFGFLLLSVLATPAAELPKGKLLEKVACVADATQSYALYVPTTFEPGKSCPVLFCFDPGARGRNPVERFTAAAEKFGYVVAGSNNSRNGPWEANVRAINAMFKDVNNFFPVDPKRIYVAGLSGGARVACQVAMGGVAKGVVACSAGFGGSEIPDKVAFPFFGTAGITDFNYLELRRVDRELDDRHAPHRVVIHNGGHEWLSSELAMEALAWLDLQAMRSGAKPRDAQWIKEQFDARWAAVPSDPNGGNVRALKSLAADFKGLAEIAAVEKRIAEISASREYRDAIKAERASERREEALNGELLDAIREDDVSAVRKVSADLRAKANGPEMSPDRLMANRILQGAFVTCSEGARELLRTENYAEAVPLLEAMTALRPERPQPFFDLARARAHQGDTKRALAALQEAAKAGFKDATRIEQEPAFAKLRREPAFLDLLSAMK